MTSEQAHDLVGRLDEAYPHVALSEGNVAMYVEKLLPLDAEIGSQAVDLAIAGSEFFPSLATIFRCVDELRAEEKRKRDEMEQRERYASEDEIERLPIAEIPGLPEFLARFNVGAAPDKPMPFQRTEIGICDDCLADRKAGFSLPSGVPSSRPRVGFEQAMSDGEHVEEEQPIPPVPRYLVGRVKVCYEHAAMRLRVGAKLEEEERS
jgi:hypothetical protein